MNNVGTFQSAGEAWSAMLREIYENGTVRPYTDNPGETFMVKESFGLNSVITRPSLPDSVFDRYKDPAEYEWMLANFTDISAVKELHNANSYAERLYRYMGRKDQIRWAVGRLRSNPEQRSCTITMFEPLTDEMYIPCVSLIDFQKRLDADRDILDMTVYCRAIDLGSKGYVNIMMLIMILETAAREASMLPGSIEMLIKSAHYRIADEHRVKAILTN